VEESGGQLRHLVRTANTIGHVSEELLRTAEQTCSSIHEEIAKCAQVISTVATTSPYAAGQLGGLDDALHLVLLEITELTSELYSVRSRLGQAPILELPSPQQKGD